MPKNNGFMPIIWIVILAVVVVVGFLIYQNYSKKQAPSETGSYLEEKYENPFDEKSQYQNPFGEEESYTNPFDNL